MRDDFFTKTVCDRCRKPFSENTRIMSRYNTDCLCKECKREEEKLPDYKWAMEVERLEVIAGNRNYPGVGYYTTQLAKEWAAEYFKENNVAVFDDQIDELVSIYEGCQEWDGDAMTSGRTKAELFDFLSNSPVVYDVVEKFKAEKKESLKLLDKMEEIRQLAAENPKNYPLDYTIRLLTAIVAESVGFTNRNDWTDELKKMPDTDYYKRINGIDGKMFHL